MNYRLVGTRHPLGIVGREIDHKPDHGESLVLDAPDANAAHFDQSCERRGRPHQEPPMVRLEVNAIVAHQARKSQEPALRRCNETERESRFAHACAAADEDGTRAGEHG